MKQLVIDLETQRSFDEVGGSHNKAKMGVSVVGTYHYDEDKYVAYREDRFAELTTALKEAELVIGFNLHGFDYPVLAAQLGDWVYNLPTLDLMMQAQKAIGQRVSLDSIAKATLGMGKTGSGLDALEYYRAGNWEKLERYCLEDVKLTKDIYEYAKKHGHVLFQKGYKKGIIAMEFGSSPYKAIFEEAAATRASVKMIYGAKQRLVDVIGFEGMYIRAYDHTKKEELVFRLDRVEGAELVPSSTPLF
ncbi:MAG: ribonuclease H-like domain-containing protein [Trueperaceae bacterium]